jgi:ATP-dependent helicase/DNAse subunit B
MRGIMLTVLTGPARCGKTEQLLIRYRRQLADQPPGGALWLSPTWRAVAEVRLRLFDGLFPGCFTPGVMTFEKFAATVLHAGGLPIRSMSRLMKRELIRELLAEQSARGRLGYFQSIAATGGLVDLIAEFISELKRLEIWPEQFHEACTTRGINEKDVELAEIYQSYQQALREHGLFDAEGRFWSARDMLQKAAADTIRQTAVNKQSGGQSHVIKQAESSWTADSGYSFSFPQFVVIDGFADFTRTQHEILEILASRAETMIVSLQLDDQSRREDLFAKPRKTLAELHCRHPGLRTETLARRPATAWPAMEQLERTLFVNPRSRQKEADRPSSGGEAVGIEILAAARPVGEMELIATRIKHLLVDGLARPGEIVVAMRSPHEAAGMVEEVFRRAGIPVVFESGQPLDRSPALRALIALLQLDLEQWPFDRLLAVLGSNFFQPRWPEWQDGRAAAEVERTIRRLQIPHGVERILGELQREASREPQEEDARIGPDSCVNEGERSSAEVIETRRTCLRVAASQSCLAVISRLAKTVAAMPTAATLPQWAEAWQQLADETGLLRAIETGLKAAEGGPWSETRQSDGKNLESPEAPPESGIDAAAGFDRRAWNRLEEVLKAGDTLAAWLNRRPVELDRRAALDALLDILHGECLGHAGDEGGYVRVLSAPSVRSLRIPYLFLAGLSERAFPPPDREDRLYGEAEYGRLIEAGLPLVARAERTCEEMLLFYEAVTRVEKRLYLSYPALDESAQPLLPSPFLREVEEVFAPGSISRVERADLSPIPADDEPVSDGEFRVKAMDRALKGNVAMLAGLFLADADAGVSNGVGEQSSKSANLAAGLELIYQRQERHHFGAAEGMLPTSAAHAWLKHRFPPDYTFGATELERYASCPFQFFMERVLRIEPMDDLTLEFDVLERGRVVHEVLAAFHHRVNERLGHIGSALELNAAEFDALLAEAIAASLPPDSEPSLQAAMREIDRRLVRQWLADYRTQLEAYAALWRDFERPMVAELLEVSFGRGTAQAPSPAPPLNFDCGGQSVSISGRIDRIDTGVIAGHAAFNVLDYKTGAGIKLTLQSVNQGITLQLPLYAMAAMELLLADRNPVPWAAGYWYVRDGGFKPRQALRMYRIVEGSLELEPDWEEIRAALGDTIHALVRAIRNGQFPVCAADEKCTSHCPYHTVCRIHHVRSLEKSCPPTAFQTHRPA